MNETVSLVETSSQSPEVVAIVVTHNRRVHLQKCVKALLDQLPNDLSRILVVDNSSDDGSREWLLSHKSSRLHCVISDLNLGGAGGFALGMREACRLFDPDWVVLMDDDGFPTQNAMELFTSVHRKANTVYAAAVYLPNGSISPLNRPLWSPFSSAKRFLLSLFAGRNGYYVSDAQYRSEKQVAVEFASFVGLFVPRSAFDDCGSPDSRLFLYCDDYFYCHELRRAEYEIVFDPKLQFIHDCSSFPHAHRKFEPLWKGYYAHRNAIFFVRKTMGRLRWILIAGLILVWIGRAMQYRRHAIRYLRLLRYAISDGISGDFSRSHAEVKRRADPRFGSAATNIATPMQRASKETSQT